MISIIIPYYNHWDLVHARLGELHRYMAREDMEVILVNDASTELDCITGVNFWQKASKDLGIFKIRYYAHDSNGGFGKSMNDGAKLADGDILIFLSNDVRVSGNFIPLISGVLRESPNTLIGEQVVDWPGGWNEFVIDGKKVIVPYANGWFLACTKNLWKEVGGFDPIYGRYDYEDVDLSTSVASLGYNLYKLNSSMLHHIGGVTVSTVSKNRQEQTEKNRNLYIAKWSDKLLKIFEGTVHDST